MCLDTFVCISRNSCPHLLEAAEESSVFIVSHFVKVCLKQIVQLDRKLSDASCVVHNRNTLSD